MEPMDITPKFRKGPSGRMQCYSDQCPGVIGEGPSEDAASQNFWKAFNKWQNQQENSARSKKHQEKLQADVQAPGGNKKRAA